jgi:Family of unknown function (DUF6361)
MSCAQLGWVTMASSFLWIDDSDQQRQRIEDALGAFTVRGTRDELGLSVIRDAFSDMLFPGTGSLQTRAAYFLFVPWTYRALEAERVPSASIEKTAKRRELELVPVLLASDDAEGTIGKRAGQLLKRLPSSVYWTGLGRLRIRRFSGSQDAYHRSLDAWYERIRTVAQTERGEVPETPAPNWHNGIPDPPPKWPQKASLRLRRVDAAYLRECIRAEAGASLLARMDGRVELDEGVPFAWDHPVAAELTRSDDPVSSALRRQLHHARCFSEVMHGAAILYNVLVAEQIPGAADSVSRYRQLLDEWYALMHARMGVVGGWPLDDLWRLMSEVRARLHPFTREFVSRWVEFVRSPDIETSTTSDAARRLVTTRERWLKGPLARIENRDARDRWEGDSALGRLDFRWSNASVLLSDIATGLNGGSHA